MRSEYRMFTHSSSRAGFTWPFASTSARTPASSWIWERQDSRAIIARIAAWMGAYSVCRSSISFTRMWPYCCGVSP